MLVPGLVEQELDRLQFALFVVVVVFVELFAVVDFPVSVVGLVGLVGLVEFIEFV